MVVVNWCFFSWWFRIRTGVSRFRNNPFHKGIPNIQTTKGSWNWDLSVYHHGPFLDPNFGPSGAMKKHLVVVGDEQLPTYVGTTS